MALCCVFDVFHSKGTSRAGDVVAPSPFSYIPLHFFVTFTPLPQWSMLWALSTLISVLLGVSAIALEQRLGEIAHGDIYAKY